MQEKQKYTKHTRKENGSSSIYRASRFGPFGRQISHSVHSWQRNHRWEHFSHLQVLGLDTE